jgi:hypothetical protein
MCFSFYEWAGRIVARSQGRRTDGWTAARCRDDRAGREARRSAAAASSSWWRATARSACTTLWYMGDSLAHWVSGSMASSSRLAAAGAAAIGADHWFTT